MEASLDFGVLKSLLQVQEAFSVPKRAEKSYDRAAAKAAWRKAG